MRICHIPYLTTTLVKTLFVSLFCLSSVITVRAAERNVEKFNHPGGVVELFVPKKSDVLPIIRYGLREPVIIDQSSRWRILIGLSLDTLPGDYLVYIKPSNADIAAYTIKFAVEQKIYQTIDIESDNNSKFKSLHHKNFSDLDFTNSEQPNLPLEPPVVGRWADIFGQVVVGSMDKPNGNQYKVRNYVMLSNTEEAVVTAPQNAMVSRIVFSGDSKPLATVFLDHGRGLYSIVAGISDLSVEIGDGVVAGAVLGKLPTDQNSITGLLWQCVINGVYVNPLILTRI